MLNGLLDGLTSVGFVPHGYCMLWQPGLIALHVVSDLTIAAAYLTIPVAIWRVLRVRRDSDYRWVGVLFAAFIALCALTHVFGLLTLWFSVYTAEGMAKAACALVSALTALRAWQLVPAARAISGPEQMREKNRALVEEVERRRRAEDEARKAQAILRMTNLALESRVEQRTAELTQSNEELERFAYVASHDLRAPLRALMTLPEWLRETLTGRYGGVHPDLEEDLGEMEVQSRRMDGLLTDLLTYARIGTHGEAEEALDVAPLVRDAVQLCAIPEGFRVCVADDLPRITANPTEFSLVIRNLVTNAVKHHDREAGRIEIGAERDGDRVRFHVSDDGPGVPERHADRIFEVFSTLLPRDEVEGSGLGLAMVKKVVEGAGGRVRLRSMGRRGSAFEFTFPAGACA